MSGRLSRKTDRAAKSQFLAIIMVLLMVWGADAHAFCESTIFNPFSSVCWECMFPVRIGGNTFGSAGESIPGGTDSPVCACPKPNGLLVGVTTSFWEHAIAIETVKDAYCFNLIGANMAGDAIDGMLSGSQRSSSATDQTDGSSQQVHYYTFPVWQMLNLFMDFPCTEKNGFDLADLTEIRPDWNDDMLAFILNPEALLFGNPITQTSCVADSVAANIGDPLDAEFWCLGSWGSTYPLSGSSTESSPTTYNAQFASRLIFKRGREGILWDTAVNKCSTAGVYSPIMVKSHYRLQVAKPRKGNSCIPVGRSPLIWGAGKNPPFGAGGNAPDNFLWIVTRARSCCVGYTVN